MPLGQTVSEIQSINSNEFASNSFYMKTNIGVSHEFVSLQIRSHLKHLKISATGFALLHFTPRSFLFDWLIYFFYFHKLLLEKKGSQSVDFLTTMKTKEN